MAAAKHEKRILQYTILNPKSRYHEIYERTGMSVLLPVGQTFLSDMYDVILSRRKSRGILSVKIL